MKKIELYGETYYKFEEIKIFIEECRKRKKSILSLEFFQIIDNKIIPYYKLQGIDSISLYDEAKDGEENAHICNEFISNCIEKCSKDLEGTYFNAVIDG